MGKQYKMGADLSVSRELSGLTGNDVAHLLGTVKGRVSRIENGHCSTSVEELCGVSVIYGVPLQELLPGVMECVCDRLKTRLANMPEEPKQWAQKRERRQETLNNLFYRLQALSEPNQKEHEGKK